MTSEFQCYVDETVTPILLGGIIMRYLFYYKALRDECIDRIDVKKVFYKIPLATLRFKNYKTSNFDLRYKFYQ